MAGELDDVRQRLEGISEELADLAIERLRASVEAGDDEPPPDERRLTRARRAVARRTPTGPPGTGRARGPNPYRALTFA